MESFKLSLSKKREQYSFERVESLKKELNSIKELHDFPALTIFCAGSYGRLEASKFSDIDMFFFDFTDPDCDRDENSIRTPVDEKRLFGKIIAAAEKLDFPKFSNDGEYLKIIDLCQILNHLGGRYDDSNNTFTARMLLLLESKYLVNETIYNAAISKCVNSYFRDYQEHSDNFKPIFLINDITRYWKTLCLNYEHRRNQSQIDEKRRIAQKVKNFKLKFSRMTTCFATIAALACQIESITESDVIKLVGLTPNERLQKVAEINPSAKSLIERIVSDYEWFLTQTGLSKDELHAHFDNKEHRKEMFKKASDYGDSMFELLKFTDNTHNFFRYLVI